MKRYIPEKSKTVSLLLAVFLGFWSWLYTYKYDAGKFWLGLILNILLFWTFVVPFGIWLWAVIDSVTKDERLLKDYYK